MAFWALVFIYTFSAASMNAVSCKAPCKIAPILLEEVANDLLIPESTETWSLKFALGRRLLESKLANKVVKADKTAKEDETASNAGVKNKGTKTDKSIKQEGPKLEQKKENENRREQKSSDKSRKENNEEMNSDVNEKSKETSKQLTTKKDSQSRGLAKDERKIVKQETTSGEITGKKSVNPETEKSGSFNKKLHESKDSYQKQHESKISYENTEAKLKKAVRDGEKGRIVQQKNESRPQNKAQIAAKRESKISYEDTAMKVKKAAGDGKKERTIQEKSDGMHQNKVQTAARGESAKKGDAVVEGSETKIARKQDQKRRIEAEKPTSKTKSSQNKNSNKETQEQKSSKGEVKETSNERIKVPHSGGKLTAEQSKGQGIKMKEEKEEEKKAVNERYGSVLSVKQNKEEETEKDFGAEAVESQVETVSDSVDLDDTSVRGSHLRVSEELADDDYGDFVQGFTDLPSKFQDTAEKVAEHLTPDLVKLSDASKMYFNMANQHIADSFSPIIGREYAPFLASVISYTLLLLPLIVVGILFEHIRALLSLQKILLFIHIYLATYFATLILASFIIGSEPMDFFFKNSLSSYIYLQLLQALGYLIYLILQTFNIIFSCSSDTFAAKLTSVLQWVVAILVGLHYYVTIFHRAMATKAPRTSWKIYGIYCVSFVILCLFARIRRLKKLYVHTGNGTTDKKN